MSDMPPFRTDGKTLVWGSGPVSKMPLIDECHPPIEAVEKVWSEFNAAWRDLEKVAISVPTMHVCEKCDLQTKSTIQIECDVCCGVGNLYSDHLRQTFDCPACNGTGGMEATTDECDLCNGYGFRADGDRNIRVGGVLANALFIARVGHGAEWVANSALTRIWWKKGDECGLIMGMKE